MYKEIEGNLITLAKAGTFDVIAHGCNCFCRMKKGVAPQMAEAFGCKDFELEALKFIGDINKLGQIDYRKLKEEKPEYGGKWVLYPDESEFMTGKVLFVVNCYTQYKIKKFNGIDYPYTTRGTPFDQEAFTLCMRKINKVFNGMHIGMPMIGSHLAGGIWDEEALIQARREASVTVKAGTIQPLPHVIPIKTIIQKELTDCEVTVVIYKP